MSQKMPRKWSSRFLLFDSEAERVVSATADADGAERAAKAALVPAPARSQPPPPPPMHTVQRRVMFTRYPLPLSFNSSSSSHDELKARPGESACVYCLENAPRTFVVPCGHSCACVPCVRIALPMVCPMCRSPVACVIRRFDV